MKEDIRARLSETAQFLGVPLNETKKAKILQVRACVRECVRACVRVCVRACVVGEMMLWCTPSWARYNSDN